MTQRIVISGCSSAGKSTLLAALAARGHTVVEEPGRRVLHAGGPRPDDDLAGFLDACVALAIDDFQTAKGLAFFDRSLIDALSGLDALGHPGAEHRAALRSSLRYAPVVLMAPPWPEIYVQDQDRTHGLAAALRECDRLCRDYARAGYRVETLRCEGLAKRAAHVEEVADRVRHGWKPAHGAAMPVPATGGDNADDPGW